MTLLFAKYVVLGSVVGALLTYFMLSSKIARRRKVERNLRSELQRETEESAAAIAELTAAHESHLKQRELDVQALQEAFTKLAAGEMNKVITTLQSEVRDNIAKLTDEQSKTIGHTGEKVLDSYNSLSLLFVKAQEKLETMQVKNESTLGEVKSRLEHIADHEKNIISEAASLRRCLRSENQELGKNWGELSITAILTGAGLREKIDFHEEVMVVKSREFGVIEEELKLLVLKLPSGSEAYVDCKHRLLAYFQDTLNVDAAEKDVARISYLKAVERRIEALSESAVKAKALSSVPFVFCFIESEAMLQDLCENHFEHFEQARKNQVALVGPTQLLPMLQMMSWAQGQFERYEAGIEIISLADDLAIAFESLRSRLHGVQAQLKTLDTDLGDTVSATYQGDSSINRLFERIELLKEKIIKTDAGSAAPTKSLRKNDPAA